MDLTVQLAQLERSELVRLLAEVDPAYTFKHVLVQETAYNSLLHRERRLLHVQIATALEQAYPGQLDEYAATLAYHYWQAEAWRPAADFSLRAGGRAMRIYALREAIGHYHRAVQALEQLPDAPPEQVYEGIVGWAHAAFKFAPYAEQLDRLARAEGIARQMNDKRRLAQVLHTIGQVHMAGGHSLRATEPMVECFALAQELGDEELAVVPTFVMGLAASDDDPRGALNWFDRAVVLAHKYHDLDTETQAVSTKAMIEARLGEFPDARRDLARALELVRQVRSPMTGSDVFLFAGWSYLDMGDVEQGLAFGKRGVDKALAADNMDCICFGFACVGFGQLQAKNLEQATGALEESVRRSKSSGAEKVELLASSGLALARFFSRAVQDPGEIQAALAAAQAAGDPFVAALLAHTLGEIYTQAAAPARAIAYLQDALSYFRRTQMRPRLARTLQALADAYAQQGAEEQAAQARAESWAVLQGRESGQPAAASA